MTMYNRIFDDQSVESNEDQLMRHIEVLIMSVVFFTITNFVYWYHMTSDTPIKEVIFIILVLLFWVLVFVMEMAEILHRIKNY